MYNKTHYNIVISLQLINVNGGKKKRKADKAGTWKKTEKTALLSPLTANRWSYRSVGRLRVTREVPRSPVVQRAGLKCAHCCSTHNFHDTKGRSGGQERHSTQTSPVHTTFVAQRAGLGNRDKCCKPCDPEGRFDELKQVHTSPAT